jgi:adenylate cyclase
MAVAGVAFVVINLLSWQGEFWAAWPILVLGFAAAMILARMQNRFNRQSASFAVIGLGLIAINMLSWHGTFWAVWPLLVLAVIAGVRWAVRG